MTNEFKIYKESNRNTCVGCRYNRDFGCISNYAKLQDYKNCYISSKKKLKESLNKLKNSSKHNLKGM